MAEISDGGGGHGNKHGKKRKKPGMPRIDMTPMVDMAFLLLTFFVMTTTLSKPKVMRLSMPAKQDVTKPLEKVEVTNALTFLLTGDDKIYYYYNALKDTTVLGQVDYSNDGLRNLLLEKNKVTLEKIKNYTKQHEAKQLADTTFDRMVRDAKREQNVALSVIIKTDSLASYKNVVDMLDEVNLADVASFAVQDANAKELTKLNAAINPNAVPPTTPQP
jgi:biopolymer transport protein ExbD